MNAADIDGTFGAPEARVYYQHYSIYVSNP